MDDLDDIFAEDRPTTVPAAPPVPPVPLPSAKDNSWDDIFGDDTPALNLSHGPNTPTAAVALPDMSELFEDGAKVAAVVPEPPPASVPVSNEPMAPSASGSPLMDESQQKDFLAWLDDSAPSSNQASAVAATPPSPGAEAAARGAPLAMVERGASLGTSANGPLPTTPGRLRSLTPPPPLLGSFLDGNNGAGKRLPRDEPLAQLRELAAARRFETDVDCIRGLCTKLGGALPEDLRAPLWGLLLGRGSNPQDAELSDWLAAGGMVSRSGGGVGTLPDHLELRNDCISLARRLRVGGTRRAFPAAVAAETGVAEGGSEGGAGGGGDGGVGGSDGAGGHVEESQLASEVEQVLSFYCRRRRVPYEPVLCALAGPLFALGLDKGRASALLLPLAHGFTLFLGTGLSPEVRTLATKHAHRRFRFLAAYHAPRLVQHLDRCYPGWEMPRRETGESRRETERLDEEAAALVDDIEARTPAGRRRRRESASSAGSPPTPAALNSPAPGAATDAATTPATPSAASAAGGERPPRHSRKMSSMDSASTSGTGRGDDDSADGAEGAREFMLERSRVPEAETEGLVPPSLLTALFAALGNRVHPAAMLPLWDYFLIRRDRHFGYFLLLALLLRRRDELLQLQGEALRDALANALSGAGAVVASSVLSGDSGVGESGAPAAADGGGGPAATGGAGGGGSSGVVMALDEESVHQWCFEAEALDRATPESFRLHLGLIAETAELEHSAILQQRRIQWEQERTAQRKEREAAEAASEQAVAAAAAAAEAARAETAAEAAAAAVAAGIDIDEDVPSMFAAEFLASNGAPAASGSTPASSSSAASPTRAGAAPAAGSTTSLKRMGRMMHEAGAKLAARVREEHLKAVAAVAARSRAASAAAVEAPTEAPLELTLPQMCFSVGAMEVVASIGRREGIAGAAGGSTPTPPAGGRRAAHMQLHRPRKLLFFFAVDCRPKAEIAKGCFPTAYQLDPSSMDDPEELTKLMEMLEPLTGRAHVVLMCSGVAAAALRAAATEQPGAGPVPESLRKAARDDYSYVTTCAIFFIKRGFPYVSVLAGGYAAAHDLLAATSAAAAATPGAGAVAGMGLSTLVDHNAADCVLCARAAQRRKPFGMLPASPPAAAAAAAAAPAAAGSSAVGVGAAGSTSTAAAAKGGAGGGDGTAAGAKGPGSPSAADAAASPSGAFRFQNMDLFKSGGGRERLGSAQAIKSVEGLGSRLRKLSVAGISGVRKQSTSPLAADGDGGRSAAATGDNGTGSLQPRPMSLKSSSVKALLAGGLRRAGSTGSAGYPTGAEDGALASGTPGYSAASASASVGGIAATARQSAAAKQDAAATRNGGAKPANLRAGASVEEKYFVIGDGDESSDGEGSSAGGDDDGAKGATSPRRRRDGAKAIALLEHRLSGLIKGTDVCLADYVEVPGAVLFEVTKQKNGALAPRVLFLTRERLVVAAPAPAAMVAAGAAIAPKPPESGAAEPPAAEAETIVVSTPAPDDSAGLEARAAAATTTTNLADADGVACNEGIASTAADAADELLQFVKSNHHLTTLVKMTFLKKEPLLITLHFRRTVMVAAAAGGAGDADGGGGPVWVEEVRKNMYRMRNDEDKQRFITLLQRHLQRFRT